MENFIFCAMNFNNASAKLTHTENCPSLQVYDQLSFDEQHNKNIKRCKRYKPSSYVASHFTME